MCAVNKSAKSNLNVNIITSIPRIYEKKWLIFVKNHDIVFVSLKTEVGKLFVLVGHIQALQSSSGPPPSLEPGQLQN